MLYEVITITRDIVQNRYSKMEMAAFLVAAGETGLDRDEVLYYTRAMADSGRRLKWDEPLVADKHCIGGVAVALALQSILGDLFDSLSIVLDKPFVVGDFLAVGEFSYNFV